MVSWLPIVHPPHGTGHLRDTEPRGPWVVLVTASADDDPGDALEDAQNEEEGNVNGDEGEQDDEHGAQVDTGESAGNRG